ncbi:MAG: hypothetical protein A3E84_03605 [Gammaproteobacteria bacterium RIFCSPHIGHO2_12_FULL_42_13]|nr:MAG: hypothetical protein A3E84_03605 [Gammaproteobacteria bacterium RIFCSPHIGHO2_12_FULL_42_13]
MALIAAMAIAMMARLQRDIYRTSLLVHAVQAELYAQGSVAWAIDQLREDWEKKQPGSLVDKLPIASPVKNMQGYRVDSVIDDAQGYFNLNNLSVPEAQPDFQHLVNGVMPELNAKMAMDLAKALSDWVTPGLRDSFYDKYYLKLQPAYRAAHRSMLSVSELRLIKGMTPALYEKLLPYVTALPEKTAINVQLAAPQVLVTLSPTLTLAAAQQIENYRKQVPFTAVDKFTNFEIVKNHKISADKVTVTSAYFLVTTTVTIGVEKYLLYTLVSRVMQNEKLQIKIVWQSKVR